MRKKLLVSILALSIFSSSQAISWCSVLKSPVTLVSGVFNLTSNVIKKYPLTSAAVITGVSLYGAALYIKYKFVRVFRKK